MTERTVTFGPDDTLAGIWTEPEGSGDRAVGPVVVMLNSGVIHHVGIWRLHVRLARRLALQGFPSLRFDLSGIGDSDNSDAATLEEMVVRDIDEALRYVEEVRRCQGAVMFGLCSGASDSLDAAVRDPRVVGAVGVDLIADLHTWQHRVVLGMRRLARSESWVDLFAGRKKIVRRLFGGRKDDEARDGPAATLGIRPVMSRAQLEEGLSQLLVRDVRLLFAFSAGLEENYTYPAQFRQALPAIADHPNVSVAFVAGADHTFSRLEQQTRLLDQVDAWMVEQFGEES